MKNDVLFNFVSQQTDKQTRWCHAHILITDGRTDMLVTYTRNGQTKIQLNLNRRTNRHIVRQCS